MDKLGVRYCLLVFISVIAIGQIIFSFGLSIKSWPLMLLGRAIFGCGETSNSVGNSAIVAEWFENKELAFAFGFNLSIARMGSVITNFVSPTLALHGGVVLAAWFGSILLGLGVLSVALMIPIDTAAVAAVASDNEKSPPVGLLSESLLGGEKSCPGRSGNVDISESTSVTKKDITLSDVFQFRIPYWLLTISCLLIYGKSHVMPPLIVIYTPCLIVSCDRCHPAL